MEHNPLQNDILTFSDRN